MNSKKCMFIFLLAVSSVALTSDSGQLKTSALAVFGTYATLTLLDVARPMKSAAYSDACTRIGLLATITALMVNNDAVSTGTIVGLIGYNAYARSQEGTDSLSINRCDKPRRF